MIACIDVMQPRIEDKGHQQRLLSREANKNIPMSLAVPFLNLLIILQSRIVDINLALKDMHAYQLGTRGNENFTRNKISSKCYYDVRNY